MYIGACSVALVAVNGTARLIINTVKERCREVQEREKQEKQELEASRKKLVAEILADGQHIYDYNVDKDRDPICPQCDRYTRGVNNRVNIQKMGFQEFGWFCQCLHESCDYKWIMRGKTQPKTTDENVPSVDYEAMAKQLNFEVCQLKGDIAMLTQRLDQSETIRGRTERDLKVKVKVIKPEDSVAHAYGRCGSDCPYCVKIPREQ